MPNDFYKHLPENCTDAKHHFTSFVRLQTLLIDTHFRGTQLYSYSHSYSSSCVIYARMHITISSYPPPFRCWHQTSTSAQCAIGIQMQQKQQQQQPMPKMCVCLWFHTMRTMRRQHCHKSTSKSSTNLNECTHTKRGARERRHRQPTFGRMLFSIA